MSYRKRALGDDRLKAFPHSGERIKKRHLSLGAQSIGAEATGARAMGTLVVGAIALGAVAIGALAIGRLAIGRARIRRVEIDELVVRKLRITEALQMPEKADAEVGTVQTPVES